MGILMRNGINYSGSQLPTITTTDEGKVLTVNEDGEWTAQEAPKELPVPGIADNGKVPTVVAGQYQLQTPSGGVSFTLVSSDEWDPSSAESGKVYLIYEV